jgi:YidC/Oxa1 family membrane protein insertase
MQQKNLVLFIALCLLILVGWPMLMNQIWKPKTPAALPPPTVRKDLLAWLSPIPNPAVPGVANAFAALATEAAFLPPSPPPAMVWQRLPPLQREGLTVLSGALAAPASHINYTDALKLWTARPVARSKPGGEPKTFVLGGTDKDYLRVVLTNKGAGVQELILTRFEAATREGRPADRPLALIQDDPVLASFLMYHYPDAEKEDSRPVLTLGERLWEYQKNDKEKDDSRKAVFTTTLPGNAGESGDLVITKTYTLQPGTYHLGLTLEIENKARPGANVKPAKFRYQLVGPHGIPIEGEWYTSVYRNPMIGIVEGRNVWRHLEETQHRISVRKGGDKLMVGNGYLQYAGVANQFFASLIVVDDKQPPENEGGVSMQQVANYVRLTLETEEKQGKLIGADKDQVVLVSVAEKGAPVITFRLLPRVQEQLEKEPIANGTDVVVNYYKVDDQLVATDIRKGKSLRPYTEDITARVVSNVLGTDPKTGLKPGEKVVHKFLLYNGPVKVRLLSDFTGDKAVDPSLVARYADDLHLNTLTDYKSASWFGDVAQWLHWTDLLIFCTSCMHWLLNVLHTVVRSWGLSIIVLTFLVRGALFPISRRQAYLSIKMQELAPEMRKIQEKYKNDPQARGQAQMELYRRHKVNPLGGCLPLVLQMPVFLGLYYCLQESIHFRLAPFLWIQNLAAPDMLWRWGENIPIPIISEISNPDNQGAIYYLGPYFNVLPVIAVVFMVMQQKMLTPPPQDEQQAFQQKIMKYMMVFFGIMFYKVAAGLCLYFIVSSLWGVTERKLLPKRPTLALAGGTTGPAGGGKGPAGGDPRRPPGGGGSGPGPSGRGRTRGGRKEKVAEVEGPMRKVRDWWAEVLKQAKKK